MGGVQVQIANGAKTPHCGSSGLSVVNSDISPNSIETLTLRSETFSTIPFAPDPDFVDRPEILTWLRGKLTQPGARAALVGLGGVGKSQVALQHAHNVCDASPNTFVFWVHGSSRRRFENAYRDIAEKLKLPLRHEQSADVLRLVYEWLSDESNGRWLMVLDNVDDAGTFSNTLQRDEECTDPTVQFRSLANYLPQSRNGCILVTSRNKNAAARLTGGYKNIKAINMMTAEEGLQLLRNKLQNMPMQQIALDLLSKLNYIPLAISQATAYMNQKARMTTNEYLDEFRTSSKSREYLLTFESVDIRRDESASNSIVTTWEMSFNRIRRERSSATHLLSLMSFFNPHGIPEDILRQYMKMHVACGRHDGVESFDQDLDLLQAYSLLAVVPDTKVCNMHTLVQLCTRSWIKSHGDMRSREVEFVTLMAQAYPAASFETKAECEQLLPHAERLLDIEPGHGVVAEAWAKALTNVASFLLMQGSYKSGQTIMRKVISEQENFSSRDRSSCFESLNLLGLLLQADGRYKEAREQIERALEGRVELFGADHEITLLSSSSLAAVLQDLGEFERAKHLHQHVFDCRQNALGADHISTLTSASNLAIVLQDLGTYEEAARWNRVALRGRRAQLGQHHPDTLLSLNNLGGVLQALGQLQDAEDYFQEALHGRQMALGESHPLTLTSMGNLASILREQGRYEDSATMSREVLKRREEIDEKHPNTFTGMSNLSRVLEEQGKHNEAEDFARRALRGRIEVLGEQHLDTLISLNNLAMMLRRLDRYEEAVVFFEQARDGLEAKFGADHPWTKACSDNFVDLEREARPKPRRTDSIFARAKARLMSKTAGETLMAETVMTLQTHSPLTLESRASSIATSSRRYGTSAV